MNRPARPAWNVATTRVSVEKKPRPVTSATAVRKFSGSCTDAASAAVENGMSDTNARPMPRLRIVHWSMPRSRDDRRWLTDQPPKVWRNPMA